MAHDHELRQEQAGFGHDHAGRVVAAVPAVEQTAGEQHVGVRDDEEREQRVGAVHGLAQHLLDLLDGAAGRAAQQERAEQRRYGGAEREADHRRRHARVYEQRTAAEDQPADPGRDVDGRQFGPVLAALQHAELGSHHREEAQRRGDHHGRDDRFDVQQPHDQRGREQADRGQAQRGAATGLQHAVGQRGLARTAVGGNPAGAGGLQSQGGDVADQQQPEQGCDGSELLRDQPVDRNQGETVGGHVHDGHTDGDHGGAAEEGQPGCGRLLLVWSRL
jgi:hypothetical protein